MLDRIQLSIQQFARLFVLVLLAVVLLHSPQIASASTLTTLFSDDFTDVDGTLLTTHNNQWTVIGTTTPVIQSNQLSMSPDTEIDLPNFASTTDQCISFDAPFPLPHGIFFFTRWIPSPQSGFESYINPGDNTYGMYEVTSGGATGIGGGQYTLRTSGTHTVKQCTIGTTTTIYLDGATVGSAQSIKHPTGSGAIYAPGSATGPITIDNALFEGAPMLTSVDPANVYLSRNLLDLGAKFDLKAEVYKDSTLVTSGEIDSVNPGLGTSLQTIPLSSFSPVTWPSGSALKIVVYARNACSGSLRNSATATLHYNASSVDSKFGATIGTDTTYHLDDGFLLGTSTGTSAKTVSVAAGTPCSSFKSFGTWTVTP